MASLPSKTGVFFMGFAIFFDLISRCTIEQIYVSNLIQLYKFIRLKY